MILYSNNIRVLKESVQIISFIINDETGFHIKQNEISSERPTLVGELPWENQILLRTESIRGETVVYIKAGKILATYINEIPSNNFIPSEFSFDISFNNLSSLLSFKQTGETSFSLYNFDGEYLFSIHDIASYNLDEYICPIDLDRKSVV